MTTLQAIVLAVLQGATELFPVSSLGHAVIIPALLRWHLNQAGPAFLPFLVMLHVGTAAALLVFFLRDWWALLTGTLGLGDVHQVRESRRVLLLIVIATIPAVIIGAIFEHVLARLFGAPMTVAVFLALNGVLLIAGERLRARSGRSGARALATLGPVDALVIGLFQCLAFLPGISRSGATIMGGLLRGIDHEGSAHFSFLIATPVIAGAAVRELPKLMHAGIPHGMLGLSLLAAVVAGVTAFLSTAFLMRYFRRHDSWALNPFAYYCIALGLAALVVLGWG